MFYLCSNVKRFCSLKVLFFETLPKIEGMPYNRLMTQKIFHPPILSAAQAVFEALKGTWTLHRIIPGQGHVDGEVTFRNIDATHLLYEEHGTLHLPHSSTEATRSYLYELKDDKIVIYYNDPARSGEVLHELVFEPKTRRFAAHHCHVCAEDTYEIKFRFISDHQIEMDYDVRGPQKGYALHTVLTRLPS